MRNFLFSYILDAAPRVKSVLMIDISLLSKVYLRALRCIEVGLQPQSRKNAERGFSYTCYLYYTKNFFLMQLNKLNRVFPCGFRPSLRFAILDKTSLYATYIIPKIFF